MVVAAKPHQCLLCLRTIPAGETYTNLRLKPWDHPENDGFWTLKAHTQPCFEVLNDSADADGWTLMPGEEFLDMLDGRDLAVVETFERWQR